MKDTALDTQHSMDFWRQQVANLLEKAQKKGATQAEVTVTVGEGLSLNVRQSEVETLEHRRGRNLSITVYIGKRHGCATTSDVSLASLDKTIDAACHIAQATGEDSFSGLAEKEFIAYSYPDLSLCHPWSIQPEEAIGTARACEAYALSRDKRLKSSDGVNFDTSQSLLIYGNTQGFVGGVESTSHSISCQLLIETDGGMQRDYDYTVARDPADLQTIQQVAQGAAERTLRRMHPKRLSTRQVPVVFDATIASSLIAHFVAAISGSAQYQKASFLLDSVDQSIFPEFVHIYERPHLIKGLGSAPFDGEGVKTVDRDFVIGGVLKSYLLNSYSARKLGLSTTGNAGGVHNLFLESGPLDQKALLNQVHTGLWITEVMGQGVNIITGDYSRGVSGFWVENGEVQYPVHEITVAGNLKEMFQSIVAVGKDVERRRNIQTGSILIEKMMVAGE